ncbi:NAD(+) synthase [bacterium]|nr:NAD(+) synthase [bacterium]
MKIAIAQINTIPFDIEGNLKKAKEYIKNAKDKKVDTIIFSGAFLCGGYYSDVLEKFPVIEENIQKAMEHLATFSKGIQIVMGTIMDDDIVVCIMRSGRIKKIVTSSDEIVEIAGLKTRFAFDIMDLEPIEEENLIIDFLPSISKANVEIIKDASLVAIANMNNAYVIHVNRVGANDEKSYDGGSRVYSPDGELLARAEFFKEDLLILDDFKGEIKSIPTGMDEEPPEEFSLDYEYDLERTYMSVCQATRDYFGKNGLEKAVIGLSGGLDSTVCAVILADVLGAENVLGVSMPSKITTDLSKQDAYQLAQNLGIEFKEIPISPVVDALKQTFGDLQGSYTMDNFQARTRATILFGFSNEIPKCISIATSDKSETYMGYATINGDMSGGFAPIADITKTKLFALAAWLNKHRKQKNVIPQSVLEKRPGAELAINPKTGKPLMAEEALMPYEFLDEVIWRIEILNQSKEKMMFHKFVYEKNNSVSKQQKEEWLDKFFCRMASATCKSNLMPVFPLIDEKSINKKVYNAPVTAKINFERIKL